MAFIGDSSAVQLIGGDKSAADYGAVPIQYYNAVIARGESGLDFNKDAFFVSCFRLQAIVGQSRRSMIEKCPLQTSK